MDETQTVEETVNFKIGDVTLESYFEITIPDYGVKIPECNTTGPITNPVPLPLYTIINFIEHRGLHPQFKDESNAEKIYYFIKAWNETSREINKKENKNLNPILANTEEYFRKKLNIKIIEQESKAIGFIQETNPFARNLLPKFKTPQVSNVYNNESVRKKFNLSAGKNPKKPVIDNRHPTEHKMYEIFKDEEMMRREQDKLLGKVDSLSEYEEIELHS